MRKQSLVSVVEDDQFFRESMRRLMRSLGHRVEAFASAADFIASPLLAETACLSWPNAARLHVVNPDGVREVKRPRTHL